MLCVLWQTNILLVDSVSDSPAADLANLLHLIGAEVLDHGAVSFDCAVQVRARDSILGTAEMRKP
jgi:hypothetical protein